MLLTEVTQVWEAATTAEAAHIVAMLEAETSVREAAMVWDSAAFRVNDVEDQLP
jgi:hypothetical protein